MISVAFIWTLVGAALTIAARTFFAAIITDFTKRFTLTLVGVQAFDAMTDWLLRHPIWSGYWRVTWKVTSADFPEKNEWEGRVYRCFDTVVAEGAGQVSGGEYIRYGFIGKLSRDRTILTGTWFDRRGSKIGYHGAYQVCLQTPRDVATGKWIGFSSKQPVINADELLWERVGD